MAFRIKLYSLNVLVMVCHVDVALELVELVLRVVLIHSSLCIDAFSRSVATSRLTMNPAEKLQSAGFHSCSTCS